MSYEPIITNNAQRQMAKNNLSKSELLAAFGSSMIEKGIVPGTTVGIARMRGYEICALYKKVDNGQYVIISCWKRQHM